MPVITLTMGKGQASPKQKKELIGTFTAAAVEITRIPVEAFTVLITELESDSIGVAGKTLEEIKANTAT
jgi:4-oxalocrotonate tautomerase